jgi:CCR4-NOT transcription complex subunit 1
LKDMA